jgi:hypothetical protein
MLTYADEGRVLADLSVYLARAYSPGGAVSAGRPAALFGNTFLQR